MTMNEKISELTQLQNELKQLDEQIQPITERRSEINRKINDLKRKESLKDWNKNNKSALIECFDWQYTDMKEAITKLNENIDWLKEDQNDGTLTHNSIFIECQEAILKNIIRSSNTITKNLKMIEKLQENQESYDIKKHGSLQLSD